MADYNELILRFLRDDIRGILITDESGAVLYSDSGSSFVREEKTNWSTACPPPAQGQKAEAWDLTCSSDGRSIMVLTSTVQDSGRTLQLHQLVDVSMYTGICRDISSYSKHLKETGDQDGLTGLFNKGKFIEMKRSLFRDQDTIAIYNMDVNNLKAVNDVYGHKAGDKLLRKAAESLKRVSARNILPFRVGGDEFVLVAIHVNLEEAEEILRKWQESLAELNARDSETLCVIACGFVFGEKGYDLEQLLTLADQKMYENKKALKGAENIR